MKHAVHALLTPLLVLAVGLVTGLGPVSTDSPERADGNTPSDADADAGARALSAAALSPQSATTAARTLTPLGFYWQLTAPQEVLPGTVLMARSTKHPRSRGTRSDREFFTISRTGSNDVPEAALRAYHRAEKLMAQEDPDCEISWTFLAAIGRVESNHGRFGGAQLGSDGVSRPAITGPRLDGAGPFAAIADSDNGRLDGDRLWDRAVGQMQFLPQTWASVARDGDGNGTKNPFDLDDSAVGSAVYLCGAGGSLAEPAGMARAAFRYNHSDYYVRLVLSFQSGYRTGVFSVPSPPPPADADSTSSEAAEKRREKAAKTRKAKQVASKSKSKSKSTQSSAQKPTQKPAATPGPKPKASPKPAPKPSPTPSPKPTPTEPRVVSVNGTWQTCGGGFCVAGTSLDLGPQGGWDERASADHDGDGEVEANRAEFTGLVGKHVTVRGLSAEGGLVVQVIGGRDYRNADGSIARSRAEDPASP